MISIQKHLLSKDEERGQNELLKKDTKHWNHAMKSV